MPEDPVVTLASRPWAALTDHEQRVYGGGAAFYADPAKQIAHRATRATIKAKHEARRQLDRLAPEMAEAILTQAERYPECEIVKDLAEKLRAIGGQHV